MHSLLTFVLTVAGIIGNIEALPASSVFTNKTLDINRSLEYFGEVNGKSFYGGLEKMTQDESFKFCEDFGMKLVALNTWDELEFVESNVEDDYWTSGETNGTWSTNGKPIELEVDGVPVVMAVCLGPHGFGLFREYSYKTYKPLCEK